MWIYYDTTTRFISNKQCIYELKHEERMSSLMVGIFKYAPGVTYNKNNYFLKVR